MTKTVTAWIKATKRFALLQALLLLLWPVSFDLFINVEVAFFSAFLIILGSMYSYARLVSRRLEHYEAQDDKDAVEKIDDPYDLYDDEETPAQNVEEIDLKAVIREEKRRIRATGATRNAVKSAPATASLFRLVPYAFLVLGFLGLNNNAILLLGPYLSGLAVGIIAGFMIGRNLFVSSAEAL